MSYPSNTYLEVLKGLFTLKKKKKNQSEFARPYVAQKKKQSLMEHKVEVSFEVFYTLNYWKLVHILLAMHHLSFSVPWKEGDRVIG